MINFDFSQLHFTHNCLVVLNLFQFASFFSQNYFSQQTASSESQHECVQQNRRVIINVIIVRDSHCGRRQMAPMLRLLVGQRTRPHAGARRRRRLSAGDVVGRDSIGHNSGQRQFDDENDCRAGDVDRWPACVALACLVPLAARAVLSHVATLLAARVARLR